MIPASVKWPVTWATCETVTPLSISARSLSDATSSLTLRLASSGLQPGAPAACGTKQAEPVEMTEMRSLRAPAIGRLRLRHPEAAPKEDSFPRAVARGDIVAFLDIGFCLRPVVAEEDATIGPPLQADGSLVGYGTPLFPII